jgi:hypothetical protein
VSQTGQDPEGRTERVRESIGSVLEEKMKVVPGHIKGSPLQSGPLISKAANLSAFADYKENAVPLFKLNKRLKIFRGEDGWFASGRHGQLWEWGKGKLEFTVTTANMITIAIEAGFVPTQRGRDEANFSCAWNDENVERLIQML